MDGFGEADVWQGSSSTAMQTLLWDPVNGIGLNLLRVGIDGTSGSANIMGAAGYADGTACVKFNGNACKVWAAPWSPPASMKDNNNVNNGGHLNSASYAAWAKILAAFPAFYKSHGGVDLYAISAQNEPDFTASYQSCIFNSSQMTAWVKVLGPALAALSPPVKVLAAEPDNWGNIWGGDNFSTALLADSTADSFIGVMATHDYGGTSAGTYKRPAPPANNTHHVWETECTPGDTGPITIATMIYAAFSTGGVNGWHYWWTEALRAERQQPAPAGLRAGQLQQVRASRLLPRRRHGRGEPIRNRAAGRGLHESARRDGGHRGGERWRSRERQLLRRGLGVAGVGDPVRHDHQLQAGGRIAHHGHRRALRLLRWPASPSRRSSESPECGAGTAGAGKGCRGARSPVGGAGSSSSRRAARPPSCRGSGSIRRAEEFSVTRIVVSDNPILSI